jgi:hypothetical protein
VYLRQSVTIPSYAASATLTLWYRPQTDDPNYKTNNYILAIKDPAGVMLKNLLITSSNSQTWTNVTYSLSAYIGQTIWIHNAYYNDGSTHGGVYLDDFSLSVQ